MRTVRDACILKEDALKIRAADEIAQLDQVIANEEDGLAFFARTHITGGLQTLMNEGLARLSGRSSQAIFHLKQAMGGGKTHLLTSMGLLARHERLRAAVAPDLHTRFPFGSAKVAAFNGRNRPNDFFWGEIARQLQRPDAFRNLEHLESPDEKAWLELFDDGQPTLILLDELPPYFDYYVQRPVGEGTMASVMTYGFATLLTAAARKSNVCVIVSDLSASYEGGTRVINKALDNAKQELGRQEKTVTPVDLAGSEIYDIIRKRLFDKLPDQAVIENIADAYGRALSEAGRAKTISRSAEAIADEIARTYPFHPRLKNLIALFKENETFRQTRGLMEIISRLLLSVWERKENDVHLIGPQHFDFGIPDVRDAIERISNLREAISRDLWDEGQSAHAQVIDLNAGNDAARQVGGLVLTASLSTAVNAVKGLTREEILECVITPFSEVNEYTKALDDLYGASWHMHTTTDNRYYFSPQENLGRMLKGYAESAPEGQIENLKRNKLADLYRVRSGTVYSKVLPLPSLDEARDEVRRGRVLLIVEPDSRIPPEKVAQFFADVTQKNNLCVLTGDRTEMAKLDNAARQLWAVGKAERQMDEKHPQYKELLDKKEEAEQNFLSTTHALFNKVLRPVARAGKLELRDEVLDMTRDMNEPFSGERQIERTLSSTTVSKLVLDVEAQLNLVRGKAEANLWNPGETRARWMDILDRAAENPAFPWLPPKGLETLKRLAVATGKWEDEGDGWINKHPQKKKTSVQVTVQSEMDDQGIVRLSVAPMHAGPSPRVYYSEKTPVTPADTLLKEPTLETSALRLFFLAEDPSGQHETGELKTWENKLKLVCSKEEERDGTRFVELKVLPEGTIRYTTDGSEPRNGKQYVGPIDIGPGEVHLLAFAEADGLEVKEQFRYAALGRSEENEAVRVDPTRPCTIIRKLDWTGRTEVWAAIEAATYANAAFSSARAVLGDGEQNIAISIGAETKVTADALTNTLKALQDTLDPESPITFYARQVAFRTGHDFTTFAQRLNLSLKRSEVYQ